MKNLTQKELDAKLLQMVGGNLDKIYSFLEENAKQYDSTTVPLALVKRAHEIVLEGFKKGLKSNAILL